MPSHHPLFIGVGGHVVAIDRTTGTEIWRRKLKSSMFCTVHFDGQYVYAGAQGELFCLDPATGEVRWHNKLPRTGTGIVSFDATNAAPAAAAQARNAAAVAAAS